MTIAHSRTRDLPAVVRRADIVVAAVGRPEMVRGDWIKPGATVIDVGINRVDQPTTASAGWSATSPSTKRVEVAGAITPVPGGVGPMTIAMLMRNTLVAAHRRAGLSDPEGYDRRLAACRRAVPTAVDAELAFARDAQRIGQWTAFRKWADRDAVMFTPQAVWAQHFLKDARIRPRRSPGGRRTALSRATGAPRSTPARGSAATASPAAISRPCGSAPAQWRWVYDGGGPLDGRVADRRAKPQTHRASCRAKAPGAPIIPPPPLTAKQARTTPDDNGRGQSADKTLGWDWKVDKNGGAQVPRLSVERRALRPGPVQRRAGAAHQ